MKFTKGCLVCKVTRSYDFFVEPIIIVGLLSNVKFVGV